jgi:hypothetical protein
MWWSPTLPEVVDPGYAPCGYTGLVSPRALHPTKPQTSYAETETSYVKPQTRSAKP